MPPAKSDLKSWAGSATRTGRASLPGEGSGPGSSLAMKVACTGCRKIKVRCLRPPMDSTAEGGAGAGDGGARGETAVSCLRCTRLNIPCQVRPHRKGVRVDDDGPDKRTSPAVDKSSMSIDDDNSNDDSSRQVDCHPLRAQERNGGGGAGGEGAGAGAGAGQGQWDRNFSIQSLLDDQDGPGMRLLDKLTVKTSLSEPSVNPTIPGSRSRRSSVHDVDVVQNGIFTMQEAQHLHAFYFERLNGVIALLTPSLNTFPILVSGKSTQFLLSAICTVSSRYQLPDKYIRSVKYVQSRTSSFTEGTLAATLENCQALSILTMWRHPQDASGWRKLHGAIIMAYEVNLHNVAKRSIRETDSKKMQLAQAQRTYYHLGCFEEFFVNQRQLLPLINWDIFQHPRQWIESLGNLCNEFDIRVASAMDTISICHRLAHSLKETRKRMPRGSRAASLQEARLIRLALAEQEIASSVWLHAKANGLPANFAMRPCGVFDNINYQLNYWQTIYAIYCRPELKESCFDKDRENAFTQASNLATEMVELFDGSYGENEYYRYVHEHVTCSLAAAAVWIVDNWRAMTRSVASRAHNAMRRARDVTLPSKDRLLEQSAYLHKFLSFCCSKLPPQPVVDQTSPIEINNLGLSDDLYWLLERSGTQLSSAIAFDVLQDGSNWQLQQQQQQHFPAQQYQQQPQHHQYPSQQQVKFYNVAPSDHSILSTPENLTDQGQTSTAPFVFDQNESSLFAAPEMAHSSNVWPTQPPNGGITNHVDGQQMTSDSILSFYQRLLQETNFPS